MTFLKADDFFLINTLNMTAITDATAWLHSVCIDVIIFLYFRLVKLSIILPQKKVKFSIKDFFSKCDQIRRKLWFLVTFTEKIFNGKPHFLCSVHF